MTGLCARFGAIPPLTMAKPIYDFLEFCGKSAIDVFSPYSRLQNLPRWGMFGGMLQMQNRPDREVRRAGAADGNPPLSAKAQKQKATLWVAFLFLCLGGEKQAPCGACAGDSKASPLPGRAAPNRPSATATRWRAEGASAQRKTPGSTIRQSPRLEVARVVVPLAHGRGHDARCGRVQRANQHV